jgi:hypothetical protein
MLTCWFFEVVRELSEEELVALAVKREPVVLMLSAGQVAQPRIRLKMCQYRSYCVKMIEGKMEMKW